MRTWRTEFAEWDPSRDAWQPFRNVTAVVFRRDGQISERQSHYPNGSIARWARLYDEDGRIIEEQMQVDRGPKTRLLYSYDQQGRVVEVMEAAGDGTRRQVEAYTYDGAGRKTKITFLAAAAHMHVVIDAGGGEGWDFAYNAAGAATLSVVHDERELPAEASFHDGNGGVIRRVVFSRDSDGHVLTEVLHVDEAAFAKHMLPSVAYAYDAKGRLVERTVRLGALYEERTTFEYDDFDNAISESLETSQREIEADDVGVVQTKSDETRVRHRRFDYVYDTQGNWVERVGWIRTGSEPDFHRSHIERRTIEYYDVDLSGSR